jgi:hypothetical protein
MKLLATLLALVNGGYMLADGIYVLANGKFIGPEKPGPWALLFSKLSVDVFKLGPMFVAFGMLWLTFVAGLWMQLSCSYWLGIAASMLTLWYIPFGTVISLIMLVMLLAARRKLGI